MKYVLLPGLDGTGLLFDGLIKALPNTLAIEVVSYDSLRGLSYTEQAAELAERFANTDIFLVAESYSGRVAYELCLRLGLRVKGVVFLASFIDRPSFIARFGPFMPVGLFAPSFFSRVILSLFGFGLSGGLKLTDPVFSSLDKADKHKLKLRLKNVACISGASQILECPVTYIRPSKDFLVGRRAVGYLAKRCARFRQVRIEGGHFIAQIDPAACANVIVNTARAL